MAIIIMIYFETKRIGLTVIKLKLMFFTKLLLCIFKLDICLHSDLILHFSLGSLIFSNFILTDV